MKIMFKMNYIVRFCFLISLLLLTSPIYGQERDRKQSKVMDTRIRSHHAYYYNPYIPYWHTYRRWDNPSYTHTTNSSLRFSIGVLGEITTQNPTISPYLVLGRKSFIITQYHFGLPSPYPHYDNIFRWEVMEWGDEFIEMWELRREFVIGVGKSFNRISPFVGVGFPTIIKSDVYKDELYILSPTGYYSIDKRMNTNVNLKIGALYEWNSIEALLQITLFDGLRIGLGIGIKL